ncbi:apolipoprotein D isoform X1 [Drosophila albomicans]|uniref:Apolipoprotein D n=1 Tax=Drosophila albomicans TaxID=7291 RepID=A0A6P8WR45_DROAB|nr:apolipoprotein D isoform X1 [Drosophila albomicans]
MQHQSLSTSIGLLMFVAFSTVFAQVPFPGQCPEVKIMDTFDLDAYMGIWYEHSKYPFAFEIGKKCIYASYENVDNSTVSVVNAAINRFTGNPTNVTGTAKVLAPAQLAVTFSKNQVANKANYLVLGTDYESYAVVYSCTALTPLAHLKLVWILTREREPTTATINDAHKILDDNKISQTVLINTLQKNCPQLEGNATDAALLQLDENAFDGNALNEAIERA